MVSMTVYDCHDCNVNNEWCTKRVQCSQQLQLDQDYLLNNRMTLTIM